VRSKTTEVPSGAKEGSAVPCGTLKRDWTMNPALKRRVIFLESKFAALCRVTDTVAHFSK
jgi:hypothetical protein